MPKPTKIAGAVISADRVGQHHERRLAARMPDDDTAGVDVES